MSKDLYSNIELTDIKNRINNEILRRGTYKWWDPLTTPSVGIDKSSPLSIPNKGDQILVDDKTYTINNSSSGSIEETRNIKYPEHGENPAGKLPDNSKSVPDTSAALFNVDEMKNYLVGLAKIQDINLFYGRDEISNTAFRDINGIVEAVSNAEKSELNSLLHESDISPTKNDPNGGIKDQKNPDFPVEHQVTYPMENGIYVMPSGEYDGEEALDNEGVGIKNFYDDYGANPGDSSFHPYNRYVSPLTRRDWNDQGHNRDQKPTKIEQGGLSSIRFGRNPRNPNQGDPYKSRPVYGGKQTSCIGACTGLCFQTCDNECSESCSSTCWNRCGEACTASCGNVCTGCSTMCYQTCKTKCENVTGYSCVKSGAKSIKITSSGGSNGQPAKNNIEVTTHSCDGCSYSCQFYPNKKTECWDAGCMGKCFTSCNTSCSTSCFGGCIDNESDMTNKTWKTGKGRGCSDGCTLNCIGACSGVCQGYCVQTCWHACKQQCSDNCSWECSTNCGTGCSNGCTSGCGGCTSCDGSCVTQVSEHACAGCGSIGGCTSNCQFDCNKNCMGKGCRSICGIESQGACESNCRLNCMGTSCTAMCSDACSDQCTTCVNTCGFQCGSCVSMCSLGCGGSCNITCTEDCSNNCNDNCVHSCSESCGGCSNLCYSCVGMCIGICSVRCENGCSSCANTCGWWCDSSCSRNCFGDCVNYCINSCVGSCSTFLTSNTTLTKGPDRPPTSDGFIYPRPSNRWEERESFKLLRDPLPYKQPLEEKDHKLITVAIEKTNKYIIFEMHKDNIVNYVQRIDNIENDTVITNNEEIHLSDIISIWKFIKGKWVKIKSDRIYKNDLICVWDVNTLGDFNGLENSPYLNRDSNIIVIGPKDLCYDIKQTSVSGGVYNVDNDGNVTINENMLSGIVSTNCPNMTGGGGIYCITLFSNTNISLSKDDIEVTLPFEFELLGLIQTNDNNFIIIIQRDLFLFPEEKEDK